MVKKESGFILAIVFLISIPFLLIAAKIIVWNGLRAILDDSEDIICCLDSNYVYDDAIISDDSQYLLVSYHAHIFVVDILNRSIKELPSKLAVIQPERTREDDLYYEEIKSKPFSNSITSKSRHFDYFGFSEDGKFIKAAVPTNNSGVRELYKFNMIQLGLNNIKQADKLNNSYRFAHLNKGTLVLENTKTNTYIELPARIRKSDEWYLSPYDNKLVVKRINEDPIFQGKDNNKVFEVWDIRTKMKLSEHDIYCSTELITGINYFTPDNKYLLLLQDVGFGGNDMIKFIELPQ